LPARAEVREARAPALAAPAGARARPWDGLARAIGLLTIVPVPRAAWGAGAKPSPVAGAATEASIPAVTPLRGAAAWFPLVGAAVGAVAGGVRLLLATPLGAAVATVLAMIALVTVTGALHQDGLADTADALGARGGRARRLEVMRDSATGVFGALALIAWALLLFTTIAALDGERALRALIVACALARWAALLHAAAASPARSDGLGAALHVSRTAVAMATLTSVALALAVCGLVAGASAIGAALLFAAFSVPCARRVFGGRTGDTLGATVAVTELAVCVALLANWHG